MFIEYQTYDKKHLKKRVNGKILNMRMESITSIIRCELTHIESLVLWGNMLTSESFKNLSKNSIKTLEKLKVLDLSSNRIKDIDFISRLNLINLEELNLEVNEIESFIDISQLKLNLNLPKLKTLRLCGNKLISIMVKNQDTNVIEKREIIITRDDSLSRFHIHLDVTIDDVWVTC